MCTMMKSKMMKCKMMKKIGVFAAVILFFEILISCKTGENPQEIKRRFSAVSWNVQALFDGRETGAEYDEYRTSSGWTQEKYAARLLSAGQAIARMINENAAAGPPGNSASAENAGTPDFIGLVELENSGVLDDLLKNHLQKYNYTHAFFGSAAGMSLGIGALSRYPMTAAVHSITIKNETIPRPLLEIRLEPSGKPLVIFLCHWKSKVGGEDGTESLRRASARVIGRRIRELRQEEPGTPVIIMGDLNENHDEFFRREKTISALLPDDMHAAQLVQQLAQHAQLAKHTDNAGTKNDFLILSREKPPKSDFFDPSYPVLYTPWENELTDGSYYYRDNCETIDHILMTEELFDNSDWDFETCRVLNFPPFTNAKGFPNSYNPRSGLGLSDHLPLLLYLVLK